MVSSTWVKVISQHYTFLLIYPHLLRFFSDFPIFRENPSLNLGDMNSYGDGILSCDASSSVTTLALRFIADFCMKLLVSFFIKYLNLFGRSQHSSLLPKLLYFRIL